MVITEMIVWWYAKGWSVFIDKIKNWMSGVVDFFSMNSLLRTLFQPYRQIAAGGASEDAALDTKFQAFIDRLVSRSIGFITRFFLLIIGLVAIILGGCLSIAMIIIWPFIPLLPVAGIALASMGVLI